MAIFDMKRGPSSRLGSLPVQDGAFIITTDEYKLYADIGTGRYDLGDILTVTALPESDINTAKFYFLTTDKCIYRYISTGADTYEWFNISKSGVTVTTGATNGTISVNGVEVAVFGLGTAAFKNVEDFDAAGSAAAVLGNADTDTAESLTVHGVRKYVDQVNGALKNVAKTGAAADVSVADEGNLIDATNVEAALAELATKIANTNDAGKVTISESTPDDAAKAYTFTQNGATIGTINIPKDMVLSDGEVVTLDAEDGNGHAAGTYLKLVLANATNSELWIPVDSLIEYVTGGATAEITVAVDPITHVVTATLNDGSIAKAKLDAGVQASLDKADSAVQSVTVLGKELNKDVTELTADEAKAALGLGTAAYEAKEAFDAAGSAAAVLGVAEDTADKNTVYGSKAYTDSKDSAMNARMEVLEAAATWTDF